ncbi:MAG TPA: hypothetical protein VNK41_01115 [Vicinamibacterales bacterium]|nr:hypothetical protein [Vicinamibacterales bacterium]
MPPRHAYWTIIIDNLPTAFRAARLEDLLPTFERLRRRHPSTLLRWFARGRLWNSPEEARRSEPRQPKRGKDWRPGGTHRDPRAGHARPSRWRKIRERRKGLAAPGSSASGEGSRNRGRPGPHKPAPAKAVRTNPKPREDQPGQPDPPPPQPPPGPDRPPRPGTEPEPVPSRSEEIVIPPPPPERGRRGTRKPRKNRSR